MTDEPSPLPRRRIPQPQARHSGRRTVRRDKLAPIDGLWLVVLLGLSAVLHWTPRILETPSAPRALITPILLGLATVFLTYGVAFGARDRWTAIISSLLVIFSRDSYFPAYNPAGFLSSPLQNAMLWGALITATICIVSSWLPARTAAYAVAAVVVLTVAAHHFQTVGIGAPRTGLVSLHGPRTFAPRNIDLWWFLVPLYLDLMNEDRRAQWTPVLIWVVGYIAASCFVPAMRPAEAIAWDPFFIILCAGGFARLLPIVIAEVPKPRYRYVGIAAAVGLVVASHWWYALPKMYIVTINR